MRQSHNKRKKNRLATGLVLATSRLDASYMQATSKLYADY